MKFRLNSRIRPIQATDLELVLAWRNADRIRKWMYTDRLITWAEHVGWFERLQQSEDRVTLIYEHNGSPAGVVNFTELTPLHRRCMWGFYLGEADLPRGSGTTMGRLALSYAFSHFEIDKIRAEVMAFNEPSLRYHEKLGFTVEGLFKRHICKGGQFYDVHALALFRDQFEKRTLE